jgi:predicted nucleic acid-binding protein
MRGACFGAWRSSSTPIAYSQEQRSSSLSPLRALDAIHVASALRLGGALSAFVSYDRRQLEAAAALGLPTASPR